MVAGGGPQLGDLVKQTCAASTEEGVCAFTSPRPLSSLRVQGLVHLVRPARHSLPHSTPASEHPPAASLTACWEGGPLRSGLAAGSQLPTNFDMPGAHGCAPSRLSGRAVVQGPAPYGPLLHHLPLSHRGTKYALHTFRASPGIAPVACLGGRGTRPAHRVPPRHSTREPLYPSLREGESPAGYLAGPNSRLLRLLVLSPPLLLLLALAWLCRRAGRPSHYHP